MLALNPSLTPSQVKSDIQQSTDKVDTTRHPDAGAETTILATVGLMHTKR